MKKWLRKNEAEFPEKNAYKLLKAEIMRIFGPRPEEAIERALGRVLTDKPSELARALANDLCKQELDCACCPSIVLCLWRRQLPGNVRAGIAHMVFNKANFESILELADKIFDKSVSAKTVSAMSATGGDLNETQPAIPYAQAEVNAIRGSGRGRGRGGRGRGGRGGRQGQPAQQEQRHKGPKHPDLPPGLWKGCAMHYKWGKGSFFCSEPSTCPWKNVTAPKPEKQ